MPDFEPIVVIISRKEVESRDTSSVLPVLASCMKSPELALSFFEKIDVGFHGYDQDPRELFEIPEVRNYVTLLDAQFPYWLFFLSKHHLGLQCIMFCFMPPFLTAEARERVFPERLDSLLSGRWFPAMNHVCEAVGFSEEEIEALSDRAVDYFLNGRKPLGDLALHKPSR